MCGLMDKFAHVSLEELRLAAGRARECLRADGARLREAGEGVLAEKAKAVSAALEAVLQAAGGEGDLGGGNGSQRGTL